MGIVKLSLVLVVVASLTVAWSLRQSQTDKRGLAAEAIKKLWSDDPEERESGKQDLLHLGSVSAEPLLALLKDLGSNQRPRFPTGKEAESAEALERFKAMNKNKGVPRELFENVFRAEISWRLKQDACELLGKLRAQIAIPKLLEMMIGEPLLGASEHFSPEMTALAEIGDFAIQPLIQTLTESQRIAESDQFSPEIPKEAQESHIRQQSMLIKTRCAMVLGKIGNASALPALEGFLERETNPLVSESLREAIEQIKKNNR
jgi:hypothetical protein